MKILLLAPQPFYQDRGTPIAVKLILEATSGRDDSIDLVTFHEGKDLEFEHVRIIRTPSLPGLSNVRPGFSVQKLICDILMFCVVVRLLLTERYDVVHAVEESVFLALPIRWILGTPYVYDMDSSLVQQLLDKLPWLAPLAPLLRWMEKQAVAHATAVVPVCRALEDQIARYQPRKTLLLQDVSLLQPAPPTAEVRNLRQGLESDAVLLLYVGNLEQYQGIDLLLKGFARARSVSDSIYLTVIGGASQDVEAYRRQCSRLAVTDRVDLLGPKPIEKLAAYLAQADILVSPRLTGTNTPMKVYSYLDSGKPVLATDLPTHTQVLDDETAFLVQPTPPALAEGIVTLADAPALRQQLGAAGKQLVQKNHSPAVFRKTVNQLYDWLDQTPQHKNGAGDRPFSTSASRRNSQMDVMQ